MVAEEIGRHMEALQFFKQAMEIDPFLSFKEISFFSYICRAIIRNKRSALYLLKSAKGEGELSQQMHSSLR